MRVQPYFILSPSERRAGSAVVVHSAGIAHGAGAFPALKEDGVPTRAGYGVFRYKLEW